VGTWIFEPGHTAAEFRARHMMVTWVRGLIKDIRGTVEFDAGRFLDTSFQGRMDATRLWTGEPIRDAHLRSADFFDVENHPWIDFAGRYIERTGAAHFKAEADLKIRGTTRQVPLDVAWLGEWRTPFWDGDVNRGEMSRIGFEATTRVNRHDFGRLVAGRDRGRRRGGGQRDRRGRGRRGHTARRPRGDGRDRLLPPDRRRARVAPRCSRPA
jgi:polyisoprenoid-binding protein YceI